ncbi:hypothetical protein [Chryseobacterium vaccae]|uniref:hypothetical protein n=1 Tax=Chryseobacterium vaccae TaxID=2604424 RepID=UPI001297FAD9|nr:hypothetical protein [Chryseobacterium vaccae]
MDENYLEAAQKYIQETAGNGFGIPDESIDIHEDVFCFCYQPDLYLQTLNPVDMQIGPGPHVLVKADERIFPYSGSYSYAEAIQETRMKLYREKIIKSIHSGYQLDKEYILIIEKIHHEDQLVSVLREYKASFIIPEIIGNSIYRTARTYQKSELKKRFELLPAEFNKLLGDFSAALTNIIETYCCEFSLKEKDHYPYASYTGNAGEKDYETIW